LTCCTPVPSNNQPVPVKYRDTHVFALPQAGRHRNSPCREESHSAQAQGSVQNQQQS
jgi:hypothetical protein